jgi:outer membrane protein TolC
MTDANYRLGAATPLDVLDAQAALTQAEFTRVEALHAHANARVGLRYVMGQDPIDDGPQAPAASAPEAQAPAPAGDGAALKTAGRDSKEP